MKLCGFETGNRNPFFLIAGPCVIESREMVMEIASFMKETCDELGIRYILRLALTKPIVRRRKAIEVPALTKASKFLMTFAVRSAFRF